MNLVVCNYFVFAEMRSWERTWGLRATRLLSWSWGSPPSTPDMSARDAEARIDSMLLYSPLPHSERANEEIPEGGGSGKLPEEGEGEKLPEGGNDKQHAESPTGKLLVPRRKSFLLFALNVIK